MGILSGSYTRPVLQVEASVFQAGRRDKFTMPRMERRNLVFYIRTGKVHKIPKRKRQANLPRIIWPFSYGSKDVVASLRGANKNVGFRTPNGRV
jgi:hypothetical protein